MAAGKMSARQKMINLMYLVFIAMLAMNMSKEVLSAFGFMNEKLTENNLSTTLKNNSAYENLATKASEQAAKFKVLNEQAKEIKKYSVKEVYLIYDDVRIREKWLKHLGYLNEYLDVKTIKKQEFDIWLQKN
jgi:gliding motility-associated protein GldM